MQFFRNRFYDPSVGRFLNRDPLGMIDGPAVYAFCGGDPVNRVDPLGLDSEKWDWHHLLAREIFEGTDSVLARLGIKVGSGVDIHASEYGMMIKSKYHTGDDGLHPVGWNNEWKEWAEELAQKGVKTVDKEMIDKQLAKILRQNKFKSIIQAAEAKLAVMDYNVWKDPKLRAAAYEALQAEKEMAKFAHLQTEMSFTGRQLSKARSITRKVVTGALDVAEKTAKPLALGMAAITFHQILTGGEKAHAANFRDRFETAALTAIDDQMFNVPSMTYQESKAQMKHIEEVQARINDRLYNKMMSINKTAEEMLEDERREMEQKFKRDHPNFPEPPKSITAPSRGWSMKDFWTSDYHKNTGWFGGR